MKKSISHLNKVEKIIMTFLGLVVLITGYQIAKGFYFEHSDITPVEGGVYIEGAVGSADVINPLFIHQGTISHDITQLIFSGLTKYDPKTREIIGDIANFKASSNGKEYTFVIKENALWHDGEPITSDDVLFTYNDVIKNPVFDGAILNYNDYSGIAVTKIDERTVQFLLEEPDSFFLVKTTTGLLPKHILENDSVEYMGSSPFNFMPVGSGRYKFIAQTNFGDHTEISLEAFKEFYDQPPHIENILIKIFSNFDDLKKKLSDLDGVRNVPVEYTEKILSKSNMVLERYYLPQYVAVFMNNESPRLKNNRVRLALQLGTDKESLIQEIDQTQAIDTPLLEIDQESWIHQYSVNKANGALFDTEWKIPEKEEELECNEEDEECEITEEEEVEEEEEEVEEPTYINSPNEGKDFRTTDDKITITGTAPRDTKALIINDYELKKFTPGDSGWSYVASKEFENLVVGENVFEVYAIDYNENKELIDSITISYGTESTFFEEDKKILAEENEIAIEIPVRENSKGEQMVLNLITSSRPDTYAKVAGIVKDQWKKIGVSVEVEVLDNGEFQQRMNNREYDLLIFGQNLGYNLDAYPYWHSSQAKVGGLNLSQFKNFVADSLLEKARYETDEEKRKSTLNNLQEIISQEVPAVFLYSPTYYFARSDKIQNAYFENLATISDRYACMETWYGKVNRTLKEGTNVFTFVSWLIKQF